MGDDAYERGVDTRRGRADPGRRSREAMLAGAAGFATSFAITHRGVDGKPVPSRFADRTEFEAIARRDARGRARRGLDRAGRAVRHRRHVRTAAEDRRAVHLRRAADVAHRPAPATGRRSTTPDGATARRCGRRSRRVRSSFALTLAAPFTFNMNSNFAELMGKDIRRAPRGLRRPQLAGQGDGRVGCAIRASPCPAGTPTRSRSAAAHPELDGRMRQRARARARRDAVRRAARPRARRARPRAAGALRPRQRRRRRGRGAVERAALHAGPVRRRRPRRASCATRRRPPTCWATGCATARRSPLETGDPQAVGRASRPARPARPRLPACRHVRRRRRLRRRHRGAGPRCGECATSRPTAERLTADNPTGVQHVLVNGTPIRADGQQVNTDVASGSTRTPGGAPARPRRTVTLLPACSSSVTTRCWKSSSKRRARSTRSSSRSCRRVRSI